MWIDRLVRFLLPRPDQFFTLLEELADKIEAAAAVFAELETATGMDRIEGVAARLKPIETEADGVSPAALSGDRQDPSSRPSTAKTSPA